MGRVGVAIGNSSPVPINNVEIVVGVLDPTGQRVQQTKPFRISNVIAPNQQIVVNTGIGPVTEQAQLQRIKVQVKSATVAQ